MPCVDLNLKKHHTICQLGRNKEISFLKLNHQRCIYWMILHLPDDDDALGDPRISPIHFPIHPPSDPVVLDNNTATDGIQWFVATRTRTAASIVGHHLFLPWRTRTHFSCFPEDRVPRSCTTFNCPAPVVVRWTRVEQQGSNLGAPWTVDPVPGPQ